MRSFRSRFAPIGVSFLVLAASAHAALAEAPFTDILNEVPDLLQIDPEALFDGMGAAFCAPVSVSNSLVWMHRTGRASLLDPAPTEKEAQIALVKRLASPQHMNTNIKTGTGPWGVLLGLDGYLKERKVAGYRLLYQGWRPHPKAFDDNAAVPNLRRMRDILRRGGGVWLNAGWYTHDASRDEYRRIGGHWLTLVGYGEDRDGKPSQETIVLHDPGPRAGKDFANEHVLCRPILSGTLTGDKTGLPRAAAGFHKLESGMHLRRGADCAILDGFAALEWSTSAP